VSRNPLKQPGTLGQSLRPDYIRQGLIETVNACREHGEPKARLEHLVYAQSFRGVDHLRRILEEAQALVNDTLAATLVGGDKS
jgi:L-2-hydroxyglutarate oxidase LhgO